MALVMVLRSKGVYQKERYASEGAYVPFYFLPPTEAEALSIFAEKPTLKLSGTEKAFT